MKKTVNLEYELIGILDYYTTLDEMSQLVNYKSVFDVPYSLWPKSEKIRLKNLNKLIKKLALYGRIL